MTQFIMARVEAEAAPRAYNGAKAAVYVYDCRDVLLAGMAPPAAQVAAALARACATVTGLARLVTGTQVKPMASS